MSIESGLVTHLLRDAAISALISTRIYPEKLPAGSTSNPTVMPCLTYQLIDEPLQMTTDYKQLFRARIQIDSWGGSYKSAHALADAVHDALQGYHGAMGDHNVGVVLRQSKRDDPIPDIELNRVIQDYFFNYT